MKKISYYRNWNGTTYFQFPQALLRKQIKSIVKRLNSRDDTEEERSESLTDVELRPETSQPKLTLKEKLQLEIDKSMKSPDPEIQVQNESGMTNSIRREMSLFENGGNLSERFQLLLMLAINCEADLEVKHWMP
ncbi:hypothetical protein EVAR_59994_1 [Eumeta japonica]|uniref:Uncharacterized protein n=1 Tax=Eumeta variegata TaxID=151549 RepID=A0A4C1ZE41_EUMVA|nr:hypothetical protein EVAR_59994_1 [Eumeta japonica]